jgi:hypothetical protein
MAGRMLSMSSCGSRNRKARRGVSVVGLTGTAAAFFALGTMPLAGAPRAQADVEDIFQPVIDAIAQAINVVDPGLASSLDPGIDVGGVAASALPADVAENATVPLTLAGAAGDSAPLVDVSVGGGASIPVEVDTGSNGLILPWNDVGLQNLLNLFSDHLTFGTVGYGGDSAEPNIEVFYVQDPNTTVDFGNGIVTDPTTVDLALFAYPTSPSNYFNLDYYSLQGYDSGNNADGTMGIAAQPLIDPGTGSVITALPGDLGEGVLINETGGYLEFGPNPLTAIASVDGVPNGDLEVSVGGAGHDIVPVNAEIDSGGVYGTIPQSILVDNPPAVGSQLADGTQVEVYTSDGLPLYSYTVEDGEGPTVSADGTVMNTGARFFLAYPIYISYSPTGEGTDFID